MVDVYVMFFLFYAYMKEGTGGSRWVRRRDMTLCLVIWRKWPAKAGGCEDGVWHCVLWYEGRGQREQVGTKTGI